MVTYHGLLKNLINVFTARILNKFKFNKEKVLFYRKDREDSAKHAKLKNCYYALCDLCAFSLRPLRFIFFLSILYVQPSYGHNIDQKERSWDQLATQYKCPKWFSEGKFGIWCHWGPQCVPQSGGGCYAGHMYMENVGGEQFVGSAHCSENN